MAGASIELRPMAEIGLQGASGLWAAAGAASPERVWWHAVLGAVGFALLANLHATARTDTRT